MEDSLGAWTEVLEPNAKYKRVLLVQITVWKLICGPDESASHVGLHWMLTSLKNLFTTNGNFEIHTEFGLWRKKKENQKGTGNIFAT